MSGTSLTRLCLRRLLSSLSSHFTHFPTPLLPPHPLSTSPPPSSLPIPLFSSLILLGSSQRQSRSFSSRRFLWGVVDSDTLPLNVSRETLQQSQALRVIKRRLVKQALDMFLNIHKDDERRIEEGEITEDERRYDKFWKVWGKSLKLGLADDASNRHRCATGCRARRAWRKLPHDCPAG